MGYIRRHNRAASFLSTSQGLNARASNPMVKATGNKSDKAFEIEASDVKLAVITKSNESDLHRGSGGNHGHIAPTSPTAAAH